MIITGLYQFFVVAFLKHCPVSSYFDEVGSNQKICHSMV